jgi:hypothetical protein
MANALVVRSQSASPIYTVTPAASVTLDFNNGSIQTITLGHDTAFQAPSNLENGATYLLKVVQDATGTRVPTWNAVFFWEGGIAPTLTTDANAIDILTFISDGTNLYGLKALDFKASS